MSTLVLGSDSFIITPDVNGDPLMVAQGGSVPSFVGGSGAPSTAPTYGSGSCYIDTTNYALYVYAGAAWHLISSAASTVTSIAGTTNQITASASTGAVALSITSNPVIPGTAGMTLPTGTTAQRVATEGQIRYNSTEDIIEGFSQPYTLAVSPVSFQRTLLYRKRRWWEDEFTAGSVVAAGVALFGDENWTASNSSGTQANSVITGIADHPGILSIATAATNANNARLHLGNVPTTQIMVANQIEYFCFLIRIPTITSVVIRLGLFDNATTTTSGATFTSATAGDGSVYFTFDSSVNAALQFFTSSTNTTSAAVNTVTVAANTWYLIEAFYNGTTWTPVVNGVTYTAQSANIPTLGIQPAVTVNNLSASSRSVQLDYFAMYTTELGARYP